MTVIPKGNYKAWKGKVKKKKIVKTLKIEYPTLKTTDSNYSKSVRLLYVVAVEDPDNAYARCYTCNKLFNIKDLDNGHYIKRKNYSVRFNRKFNSRPQCTFCNCHGKGEQDKYRAHLIKDHGSEEVAKFELFAERNKNVVKSIHGYALYLINEESKQIIKTICKEKGINRW